MDLHDTPGDQHSVSITMPVVATTDATAITGTAKIPFKATLTRAFYTPTAAITGTDTNSRSVTLKDVSGNVLFQLAFLATPATNAVAGTPKAMPAVGTAAQLAVAADAGIQLESTKVGTGLAIPIGTVTLHFQGR